MEKVNFRNSPYCEIVVTPQLLDILAIAAILYDADVFVMHPKTLEDVKKTKNVHGQLLYYDSYLQNVELLISTKIDKGLFYCVSTKHKIGLLGSFKECLTDLKIVD